jgi:hypothetical protein
MFWFRSLLVFLASGRNGHVSVSSSDHVAVEFHCCSIQSPALSRRLALKSLVLGSLVVVETTNPAFAQETLASPPKKKPYAPLENLVPATRVRILIDRSFEIARALKSEELSVTKRQELLSELQTLLLEPHSFLTKQEASKAKRYLEIDTLTDWTRARQKEAEQNKLAFPGDRSVASMDPLTRLNEGFEQWGERRQFGRLQRQQIALEKSNPMRAAFNAYTNNLIFGDSYELTASQSEKSRMIRDDRVPDVTSVIRSDLDLRDLYRNQVLTAVDDARAELKYQLQQESLDLSELVALLSEAQTSCNKWFDFVPENDAREAMERVLAEGGNKAFTQVS